MPTVNLYDYDTAAEDIARRQQVVDALRQQAMTGLKPTQVGNYAAPPHWMEAAAKLLSAYSASKGQEKLTEDRQTAAEKYRTGMKEGFEQYFKTAEGGQEPSFALKPDEAGNPQMVNTPANPRKAIFDALASGHPVLREFATQQLKDSGKDRISAKDLLPYVEPSAIPGMVSGGTSGFKPKRDIKTLGDQFWDVSGQAPTAIGGVQYGQPSTIGGDLYQPTLGTGKLTKLDNAPRVTTNVSVSPTIKGEGKFMEKVGEQTAELVGAARSAQQRGQQAIVMADRMEQLMSKGVFTGPTANLAVAASSLADALKIPGVSETLGRSEEFRSLVGKEAAAALSGPGGAKMTDKDMELFLSQYPQLTASSQGQKAILGAVRAAAKRDIDYGTAVQKRLMETYPEAGRLFEVAPTNLPYPVETAPVIPGRGGPKVLKWEDLK